MINKFIVQSFAVYNIGVFIDIGSSSNEKNKDLVAFIQLELFNGIALKL